MKNISISITKLTFAGLLLTGGIFGQDAVRRVSQEEAVKAATSKVQPDYPAMARQLKLEGAVQVEAVIDEKGSVETAKPMNGNVILANSAVAAVKRWRFTPFTSDGKPVKAIAAMSFTFRM